MAPWKRFFVPVVLPGVPAFGMVTDGPHFIAWLRSPIPREPYWQAQRPALRIHRLANGRTGSTVLVEVRV